MENWIVSDEVFNRLEWKDAKLCELLGCTIIGVEPIKDGTTDNANTTGLILYLKRSNGNKLAFEIKREDEFKEIFISAGEIYES